jgi:hypothetical protein
MKISFKILFILVPVLLAGCSKEEPAKNPPAEPAVLTPATQTLHKAEDLDKVVADEAAAQRKQIEESTQ